MHNHKGYKPPFRSKVRKGLQPKRKKQEKDILALYWYKHNKNT